MMHMWTIRKMGMRTFLLSLLPPLSMVSICIFGLFLRSASADPSLVTTIVLTPSDVSSLSYTEFTTLPTEDPSLFGFGMTGAPVQKVDFDFDPFGEPVIAPKNLTNEFSSIGVLMNDIRVDSGVAGGAASPPNATTTVPENPTYQIFTFTVPVLEVGIINTTPDYELYEFFDENENLLAFVYDPGNPDIDTFIGAKVSSGPLIKTFRITNVNYAMELDELIFTPLAAIQVMIDIKPGSYPNCFNINDHGVIPVAILGCSDFDVSTINLSTLSFGGLDVRVRGNKGPLCHLEDISGDGYIDLVCQFEDDSDMWVPGDDHAVLSGSLLPEYGGKKFEGSDSICVKP